MTADLPDVLVSTLRAAGYRDVDVVGPGVVSYELLDRTARGRTTIAVGNARSLDAAVLRRYRPDHVVIENRPDPRHLERVIEAATEVDAHVRSLATFLDVLWDAERAAQWIEAGIDEMEDSWFPFERAGRADAHAPADRDVTALPGELPRSHGSSYVFPPLVRRVPETTGGEHVSMSVREWVDGATDVFAGCLLYVVADAGFGKSELTRALQRRACRNYRNSRHSRPFDPSPLALRIPLRRCGALTFGSIRDFLVSHVELFNLTEPLIRRLLRLGRIILLLDGLDEMDLPAADIARGFRSLQVLAHDGGRILVTARTGTKKLAMPSFLTHAIKGDEPGETVPLELGPLDEAGATRLLELSGYAPDRARETYEGLPPEIRGVPLFLVWACESEWLPRAETRPMALRDLIDGVCARECRRRNIGLDVERQVEFLSQIALESRDEPVRREVLRDAVPDAQFVEGPHVLLRLRADDTYAFKHESFEYLMLAHALDVHWRLRMHLGAAELSRWLHHRLGRERLDRLATDYLADLLPVEVLAAGWSAARLSPAVHDPEVAANVLAIAVAQMNSASPTASDFAGRAAVGQAEIRDARARLLAGVVTNRDLSGSQLDRIVISQVAFRGWRLTNLRGEGGEFQYCSFDGADVDSTIRSATLEGCTGLSFALRLTLAECIEAGIPARLFSPWVERRRGRDIVHPSVPAPPSGSQAERDMGVLERHGIVRRSEAPARGEYVLADAWRRVAAQLATGDARLVHRVAQTLETVCNEAGPQEPPPA